MHVWLTCASVLSPVESSAKHDTRISDTPRLLPLPFGTAAAHCQDRTMNLARPDASKRTRTARTCAGKRRRRGGTEMTQTVSTTYVLQVGSNMYPVYGDAKHGWCIDEGDLAPTTPSQFRYRSLDELFFALANLNASH